MKKLVLLSCVILFCSLCPKKENWSEEEIKTANTAVDTPYLSQIEKDVVLYLNLARLYPAKFAQYEVEDYLPPAKFGDYLKNSPYKKSLLKQLKSMSALAVVQPDEEMYQEALCLLKEQKKSGKMGHDRRRCQYSYAGECCSYGMETGLDITMQLLIDDKIKELGHRKICLGTFQKIGTAAGPHPKTGFCAVLDFH